MDHKYGMKWSRILATFHSKILQRLLKCPVENKITVNGGAKNCHKECFLSSHNTRHHTWIFLFLLPVQSGGRVVWKF